MCRASSARHIALRESLKAAWKRVDHASELRSPLSRFGGASQSLLARRPGAFQFAELRRGRLAEPPLAADPVPVPGRLELAEHGEHAGFHPAPHELVRGQ